MTSAIRSWALSVGEGSAGHTPVQLSRARRTLQESDEDRWVEEVPKRLRCRRHAERKRLRLVISFDEQDRQVGVREEQECGITPVEKCQRREALLQRVTEHWLRGCRRSASGTHASHHRGRRGASRGRRRRLCRRH